MLEKLPSFPSLIDEQPRGFALALLALDWWVTEGPNLSPRWKKCIP